MLPGDKVTDSIALTGTGSSPGSRHDFLAAARAGRAGRRRHLHRAGLVRRADGRQRHDPDLRRRHVHDRELGADRDRLLQLRRLARHARTPARRPRALPVPRARRCWWRSRRCRRRSPRASMLTGHQVDDSIIVHGTGGQPGTITWALIGPVAPAAGELCRRLVGGSADRGPGRRCAVTGDGTYTTPVSTLTDAGCYGYQITLSGVSYGPDVTSPAGTSGEVAQAMAPAAEQTTVDLTVSKRVNTHTTTFGKPLTYTLTVANGGPGTGHRRQGHRHTGDEAAPGLGQVGRRQLRPLVPGGLRAARSAGPRSCDGHGRRGSADGRRRRQRRPCDDRGPEHRFTQVGRVRRAHDGARGAGARQAGPGAQRRRRAPGAVRDHRHQPDDGGREAGARLRPVAARARVRVGLGQDQAEQRAPSAGRSRRSPRTRTPRRRSWCARSAAQAASWSTTPP